MDRLAAAGRCRAPGGSRPVLALAAVLLLLPAASRAAPRATVLDGPWLFQPDPDEVGEARGWHAPEVDRSGWRRVSVPMAWDFHDPTMESDTAGASGSVSVPLLLHDPPLWSLGHPELETARVELLGPSGPVDSLEERFGVRSIEAKGRQVPLNGRPVRVRGVNRYDEFPGRGPVVDEETIREDLLAVKALGAIQALWRAEMERAAP